MHGFVVVDKPAGWTSHDVVARARRVFGERQIGHAGTLDPAATGVLPLAVGSATKVLEYLIDASKTYVARVAFGVETDSADGDGTVTMVADPGGLNERTVIEALARFRGPIEQAPPMHSAVKVGGKRLYDLARRGETIARAARQVTVHHLELIAWEPPVATLMIDCSKGTYVRSLAHDLGRVVGVGAYLDDLVRVRTGPFTLCEAWTLAELGAAELPAAWPEIAHHPDMAAAALPAILLNDNDRRRWSHGLAVASGPAPLQDEVVRAYDQSGGWLGVGRGDATRGAWRPTKVIESGP